MADLHESFVEGFRQRLEVLFDRHKDVLYDVEWEDAHSHGARAAEVAVAPFIWAAAIGERWDTTAVTEFLHVSRQAVHKRVGAGTLLGLPGQGTTWFPVWQFDLQSRQVRPIVGEIIGAFREELDPLDPLVIASWATTDQPELDMSPEQWLESGRDPQEIARIARRTARELAR